ncbi:MAG: YggT family protein [Rectinema sp.]
MVVTVLARVLGAAVSLYMLLCTIRVFMTWVPNLTAGKFGALLARIVDPYFALFSRFRFLRAGQVDFSPVIALIALSVLGNIFTTLAYAGTITVGYVLSIILSALWSVVGFVLTFLTICAVLRIIVYALHFNSLHPLIRVVDSILNPALHAVNRVIYRNRAVNYLQGLITGFIILLILRVGCGALIGLVNSLLRSLPF